METGNTRIRLDDRGQLRASVDCLTKERLDAYRRERDKDNASGLLAPFILPGMGRVTTDPNSDKFGALVHVSERDGTFVEQWMLEDPPAPTAAASSATASSVTIGFGANYQFTGTPESYPRRLPWLRPDAPLMSTAWMALSGGTQVTAAEFFAAALLRPQARYACAVITKNQIAAGTSPTVLEKEHIPHGAPHGLRWEEWLQNPQSSGKAWVYGEWARVEADHTERKVHMAWSADPNVYAPVPDKDSHSEANPSNTMHLEAWLEALPSRFPGTYFYASGVVHLYANAAAKVDAVCRP